MQIKPKIQGNKEWIVSKSSTGTNIRIYTRYCNYCGEYYEGRGKSFCGKVCSAKWGRKTKDYSASAFKKGKDNPNANGLSQDKKDNLSRIMKKRWADGKFTGTIFSCKETKLERITRETFEKIGIKFKPKFWLSKTGWKPKEYDFYLSDFNVLVEVDGLYWHSLPENIENDAYKDKFAQFMGYKLLRIPECFVTEDAIRAAVQDVKSKSTT